MRAAATPLALLLVAALTSGCVQNMPALKELLGAREEVADPVYEPPLARAHANATAALPGVPVRFTSDGSRDPQALPLSFSWDMGDGTLQEGATVVHAFAAPGEYRVRLRVVNEQGLSDEDALTVQVGARNRAPEALFRVMDAKGVATASGEMGEPLTFDAAPTGDPDGDALTLDWDFGDGATSHDARATHAFNEPGLYLVRLVAKDPAGLASEASRLVAVNATFTFDGAFELTTPERLARAFPLAEGAAGLTVVLSFPGGGGLHDLEVVLKDADGKVVAESAADPTPGAQDEQTRALPPLTSEALRAHAAGEWTVEVVKQSRVPAEFKLTVRETF